MFLEQCFLLRAAFPRFFYCIAMLICCSKTVLFSAGTKVENIKNLCNSYF